MGRGMLMEAIIREATPDDYDALCELLDEVDALHRDNLPHLFQRPTGPVREQAYYLSLIADENVGLFVAEVNKRDVGFVHVVLRDAPAIPILVARRYAIVDGIGVKSDFRRGGIGRRLMHKAQEWATAKGASAIELNVHEFNQGAISFYQRLGFDIASRKLSKVLDK